MVDINPATLIGARVKSIPRPLTVGLWTLTDSPSAGGDTLTVTISTAPDQGASVITSYEFRRNGGAWSTLPGGTALGARNITVLATTLANIELRAINAVGPSAVSDSKSATPTVTSGEFTARFGVGADNASGTGAFDTNLYPGTPPANGTYGNFSVTSGVITPNGSQTIGSYDVGGWPVQVISGYKAIANQTQLNAVTAANSSGKTILIREGAGLNVSTSWNGGADFNWATILGDGEDPRLDITSGRDSRKHFTTWNTVSTKRMIFDNLRIVPGSAAGAWVDAFQISQSGSATEDIHFLRSVVVSSRPDPFGDYTAGESSYPGARSIFFQGDARRISIRDNVVIGNGPGGGGWPAAIQCEASNEWCEIVGNWVDMFYIDAIRASGNNQTNMILGGNLVTRPMSRAGEPGDPHCDGTQWVSGGRAVAEASAYVLGECRGEWQAFFAADGVNNITARNILVADVELYQITIFDPDDTTIENCTWMPKGGSTFPLTNPTGGIRNSGIIAGTPEILNSVYRLGSSLIDGGVTQTGNINAQTWTESDWNTNFPNWSISGLPTLQNAIQFHGAPSAGGAAAGKGANQNITSWGTERSSYVLNVPTPVVSNITITPTTDGFTGTLRTSVGNNAVYYAVIPQAQGNPTYREIKERRVPNAVGYGSLWCKKSQAGTDRSISITTAAPGTAYKFCAVAENGWSVQSAVTTANFTTAAAAISLIATGATERVVSTSINVPLPAAAANGDYLVVVVCHAATNSVPSVPAGWTLIGTGFGWSANNPVPRVFGRIKDGTEGSTLTLTTPVSNDLMAFCAAYRGVSGDGLEGSTATFSSTSSGPTNSITATAESCILHIWTAGPASSSSVTTPNAGARVAEIYNVAGDKYIGMEHQLSVSAGATTGRTATNTVASNWSRLTVELLKA